MSSKVTCELGRIVIFILLLAACNAPAAPAALLFPPTPLAPQPVAPLASVLLPESYEGLVHRFDYDQKASLDLQESHVLGRRHPSA